MNIKSEQPSSIHNGPVTESIVMISCGPYKRGEYVLYAGPDAICVGCDEQISAGALVVLEGDNVICEECENDARMWSTVMHGR